MELLIFIFLNYIPEEKLAVLFYDDQSDETEEILSNLEEIDDDLDAKGVLFVKVSEAKAAFEYGIEERPSLVVFDKGIPSLYEKDDFKDANQILKWITGEVSGEDTVEAVTDSMLDMMIAKQRHVAAFFYSKQCKKSLKTLGKYCRARNLFEFINGFKVDFKHAIFNYA